MIAENYEYAFGNCDVISLPVQCIKDCSGQGDMTENVKAWRPKIVFPERALLQDELKEYGAYDDLDIASTEEIQERFLWIACCNASEMMDDEREEDQL